MIVVTVAPIFSRSLECSPRFLEFPIERVLKIPCNFLIFPKFLVIPWDSLKLLGILWDSQRILKIPNQLLLHIYTDLLALKHLYLNFKFIHEFWSNSVFTFPNSTLQFDMSTICAPVQIQCDKVSEMLSELLYVVTPCLTPRTGCYKRYLSFQKLTSVYLCERRKASFQIS